MESWRAYPLPHLQLSSSRNIDVNQPFDLMSNSHGNKGTRYAVLIGINYTTHKQGRLSGCHNDVANIRKYIMDVGKFQASNITILLANLLWSWRACER